MALWDAAGNLLTQNDDDILGLTSVFGMPLTTGNYVIGITEYFAIFKDGFNVTEGEGLEPGKTGEYVLRVNGVEVG